MRIVVLQPNLIGDVIATTPMLRAIRNSLPQAHVTIVLGERNIQMRPLLGELVDDVLHYRKRALTLARLWALARLRRFDYLFDLLLDPLKLSHILVPLIGAKTKIALARDNAQLYDVNVQSARDLPVPERYLALLQPLGISPPPAPKLELFLPGDAIAWAQQHWPATSDRPAVLVNIRGAGADKFWGVENFVRWIRAIRAAHPELEFVVVGHGQEADVAAIAAQAPALQLPRTARFADFAACVGRANYLLSPDTGVIHVAAALGKPLVGLYRLNPRDYNWTPYRCPHVIVKSSTERVGDIPLPQTVDAFERLLAENPAAIRP
jgi:ADP-heptose:LPS heptosyltransferase